jgi:hypothetical protein
MLKNKAINAVGIIVTFACIGLFFDSFTNLDFWQLAHLPRMELFAVTATATMIYASLLVAVGIGFASLVRSTGHAMATPQEGIALWGQANIAKYLPGNVMHFAGRQLLARRFDWPQASTTTASVLELALQVLMSCSIGVAGLLMIDRMNTEVASSWLVAALFLSSAVLTVALLGRLQPRGPARLLALDPALRGLLHRPGAGRLAGLFLAARCRRCGDPARGRRHRAARLVRRPRRAGCPRRARRARGDDGAARRPLPRQ